MLLAIQFVVVVVVVVVVVDDGGVLLPIQFILVLNRHQTVTAL